MKIGLFSILMVLGILYTPIQTWAQSVGVSNTAITPDASSMFEVRATNKGMLITRVALTATNAAGPITSPATSLLVYNTATAGSGTAIGVYPGYYYNAGTPAAPNWKRLAEGTGSGDAWLTTGNFGTLPANNWLGTNDAQDFVIRSNNTERMRVVSGGNVIVNTAVPIDVTDALEVVVSPTFTTGLGAYGNGGYPIWGEQLSGADDAITGINSAATGAGAGAGIYGYSSQTGAAGVWGSGGTTTRGVLGTTNNDTYAGVHGQNEDIDGDGVIGINNAATGAGIGAGVYGYSAQTGAAGVFGSGNAYTRGVLGLNSSGTYAAVHAQNSNASGTALYAANSAANGTAVGFAVDANSNQTGGATIIANMQATSYYPNAVISSYHNVTTGSPLGVISRVGSGSGYAVYGYNAGTSGSGTGSGVLGRIEQSNGFGVNAINYHASGTGIIASGNNAGGSYLTTGTGGAFTGDEGSYSQAVNASGTGVIGIGNNNPAINTLTGGSGGAFTGNNIGVYGNATGTANGDWGGYFCNARALHYAYIGGRTSNTNYKINGPGSVATIVERPDGTRANMFCPEAPEILFQDYGTGQLSNGKAHIELDPILTKNIYVDDEYPMKVFIQLEGDCKGVYVTNKSTTGFDVIELQSGNSNVPFSWTIVANRSDSKDNQGNIISEHVGVRFPDGPGPLEMESNESQQSVDIADPKAKQLKEQGMINNTDNKQIHAIEDINNPTDLHAIEKVNNKSK